ncbi:MAG: hypothetical protein AAB386_02475 [Patescibacteria group bacterium]
MQQSNILINGIMRTGSGVWEVWVVEYGRRISTGEACAGAHRAQESICAGEEELREFDRKLGAFFEDDRPIVALDALVQRKSGASYVKNHDGNATFGQALGYPYWADNCLFLFMAPAGNRPWVES